MKCSGSLCAFLLAQVAFLGPVLANDTPTVTFEDAVTGVEDAVYWASPNDDSGRLFVVSSTGIIHVHQPEDAPDVTTVFLDIQDKVNSAIGGGAGMYGLAFHPDFARNGRFVVKYVDYGWDVLTYERPNLVVLSEFTVSESDPNVANTEEKVIMQVPDPHIEDLADGNFCYGSSPHFGPDGLLYMGVGNGGRGCGENNAWAQDPETLFGKIIRIDVDACYDNEWGKCEDGKNYGIPATNPFAGYSNGGLQEIYRMGVRQPYMMSFDEPACSADQTGLRGYASSTDASEERNCEEATLWFTDVGDDFYDEFNAVDIYATSPSAINMGWNVFEGYTCNAVQYDQDDFMDCGSGGDEECYFPPPADLCDPIEEFVFPPYAYPHENAADAGGLAIGPVVYRGEASPENHGVIVYLSWTQGTLYGVLPGTEEGVLDPLLALGSIDSYSFGGGIAINTDQNGEIYVINNADPFGAPVGGLKKVIWGTSSD